MLPASPGRACIFRYGRFGWPAPCVRRCALHSVSSRRYIGGVLTFTRRAARSTSRGRARKLGILRASDCAKGLGAPLTGTVNMAGSDTGRAGSLAPPLAKAQEQLFAPGKSSRAKYAELVVGRPGLGPLIKHELVVLAAQAVPGALGLAL